MPDTLIQLPNRDLWRGVDLNRKRPDNVTGQVQAPTTPEAAQEAAGNKCLWCDQSFPTMEEVKAHVESLHFAATHAKDATPFITPKKAMKKE